MKPIQSDVIIVGGGPAGIATAITCQALGISNCIVEAAEVPKQKYGEALPPNAKPILRQLGILDLVEAPQHIHYYGNRSSWGNDRLEQKEFIEDLHGHGFLLDRPYFEQQLWNHYINMGGFLLNGHRLSKLTTDEEGVALVADQNGQKKNLRGKYIVDATGRKASVCRQLGIPKIELDTQFALSFTMKSDRTLTKQILIEATGNGWWYAAPNEKNDITLMFFTLKQLIPKSEKVISFLQNAFDSTIHLSQIFTAPQLSEIDVKIMPAGTSRLAIPYGNNWITVGDAAVTYDPISSYGITSALASGYYAGHAIASKLDGKMEAMDAYRYVVENGFQAYCEKLDIQYRLEQRWPESDYWAKRFG